MIIFCTSTKNTSRYYDMQLHLWMKKKTIFSRYLKVYNTKNLKN